MKLIDIDSKATLEDLLTLKKTELVQFLWKCREYQSLSHFTRHSVTRPNRISQNQKNIKLFMQWLLSTNFPFLVLVTQINSMYIFLNIVC